MRAAGYDVTMQEYKVPYFNFVGTPVLRESRRQSIGANRRWPGESRPSLVRNADAAFRIGVPTRSRANFCEPAR
jgi:hypothetical protein